MLGAWHEDETGQCYLYFHGTCHSIWGADRRLILFTRPAIGYPTTRILNALSDTGTPIVATATLVDGLVLALSAFSHSMNYRSYAHTFLYFTFNTYLIEFQRGRSRSCTTYHHSRGETRRVPDDCRGDSAWSLGRVAPARRRGNIRNGYPESQG
jgi:hypothetical protein